MAQKRMFDKRITDSDKFMDLPNSSKALYFMAGMNADDRGFFQPRRLQRECGFSDDDYKILIAKGYLIPFESGVMVITDWNKNNWLDKRRITETEYIDELNMLNLVNEKYELNESCLASAKRSLRENRIEQNRIEENSIDNTRHKFGTYGRVKLTTKQYEKLVEDFSKEIVDKKIEQLDEYVESNNNKNKYSNFNLVLRKAIRENWWENQNVNEHKTKRELQEERFKKIEEDFLKGE